jgi:hypothetical protein
MNGIAALGRLEGQTDEGVEHDGQAPAFPGDIRLEARQRVAAPGGKLPVVSVGPAGRRKGEEREQCSAGRAPARGTDTLQRQAG